MNPRALWRSLRPNQWTKNVLVLAALVFALGDRGQTVGPDAFVLAGAALALFCLVSSAVYVMNDLHDVEKDRLHPVKRHRPFASGALSRRTGYGLATALAVLSIGGAAWVRRGFMAVLAGYFLLQVAYTFALKRIAFVDILVIALGFVLRAWGGGLAIGVPISHWLLLCTLLLSLFLALCKRRHERVVLADAGGVTREALRGYSERMLDRLIAASGLLALLAYAAYTTAADTVAKFGSAHLIWTLPFVAFGLYRYHRLVYRHEQGGRPEHVLLNDRPILLTVLLYGATVLILLLARRG